jgi:hypothetical protein
VVRVSDSDDRDSLGPRKAAAVCPECGALVDVTHLAFVYLDRFGEWNGVEDCWECSTALAFTIHLDSEGKVQVACERV